MTSPMYLTRARLRHGAPISALRELLVPDDEGERMAAAHRLMWTLFSDSSSRRRDFLWRESDEGQYYILSARLPQDSHGLFDMDAPKAFAPALVAGDRVDFVLRANATVSRSDGPGRRGRPYDVVMDALYRVPRGARSAVRAELIAGCARKWLGRLGVRCGFQPGDDIAQETIRVTSYRSLRFPRRNKPPVCVGVLDLEGVLEVTEPAAFTAALFNGFGRAKAFGCGLMLIRRAAAAGVRG